MDEFAKNEPRISGEKLLSEMEPLLLDFFEGLIYFDGKSINYILPNGQKFLIKAKPV